MTDLEGAAADTLARLRELRSEIGDAHQAFARLGEEASATATQLDTGWNDMVDRVGAFLEGVGQRQGALADEVEDAGEAFNALAQGAADARAEAEEELGRAHGETSGLADQVTAIEPTVAGLAESVDAVFQSLSEQAQKVEESLEQAVGAAREFLQEQASSLKELQGGIREAGEEAGAALDACTTVLEQAGEAWGKGIEEVEATVEKAFGDTADHLHESVDLALDECLAEHEQALDAFVPRVAEALQALLDLAAAVQAGGDSDEAAVETHASGMEEAEEALREACAALDAIRVLLSQYTFVQL